jgi:predicted RNA-binding Zn ribbon-like protein
MPDPFKLVAGHLALDFANTLDDRYHARGPVELIRSYADFLRFAAQSHILTSAQARALATAVDDAAAGRALKTVRALREAIERLFSAAAHGRRVPRGELALLNRFLGRGQRHRVIASRAGSLTWDWEGLTREPGGPLWPIVFAAAELLASDARRYVRQCECATCRWLFLDTTKNRSRKWCDMNLCGGRMKARAYYRRRIRRTAARS